MEIYGRSGQPISSDLIRFFCNCGKFRYTGNSCDFQKVIWTRYAANFL